MRKRMRMSVVIAVAVTLASLICGEARAEPYKEPDFLTDRVQWYKAQIRCLRDAVYTEARGEDDYGQRMVAWVVAGRALDNLPHFGGGTICKVVYATHRNKKGQLVSQFSGPTHHPVKVPDDDPVLRRAEYNARRVLLGSWQPKEELREARYYQRPEHADRARSAWFKKLQAIHWVGNHIFYREKSPG